MRKLSNSLVYVLLICLLFTSFALNGCNDLQTKESYLVGVVNDVEKQVAISGVVVEIKNNNNSDVYKGKTDFYGKYKIACERGYYQLTATKKNYSIYSKRVTISKGQNQEDFYLSQLTEKPCILTGKVVNDKDNKPIPDADVQVGENLTRTDKSGNFKFDKLPIDKLNSWITAPGFEALNTIVSLTRGKNSTTFRLKPLGSITDTNKTQKRNVEYAVSPSTIDDYKAHSVRVVYPEKERHEYWLISQDRYNRYLKFDETVKQGEFVYTGIDIYIRDGKLWKKADPSVVLESGDVPFQIDLLGVLNSFNFEDKEIDISFIGTEQVNGYKTRKYQIVSKPDAAKEKVINVYLWIIDTPDNMQLNRVVTKITGRTTLDTTNNNYAVVDIDFTDIGKGNKVNKPV
jgi:hypothetical protein